MRDAASPGSSRGRAPLSVRIRVGLSLGIVLGLGSVGTMALWSSSGTVTPGSITAAQLDVTVNGSLAGAAGRDGSLTVASWNMVDMLPGEQRALSFTVANGGVSEIPVDIRLNAYATGAFAPALRFTVYDGGTATNSGGSLTAPQASTYRTGSCPGGVQIGAANQVVGATAAASTVIDASKQRLEVGQSMVYCVVVVVDNTAATHTNAAFAGAAATAFFVVRGTQVGAP